MFNVTCVEYEKLWIFVVTTTIFTVEYFLARLNF